MFDLDIDAHSIRGTGHATTAIWFNEDDTPVAMATNADADAPGFWCWTASGNVGMCAPQQDQCDAERAGFNQTSGGLGGASDASACALQSSAWTSDGVAMFPSKKTCGEHCRRVR